MRNIHVGNSGLSNTIFAGHLEKTGTYWSSKQDVTTSACAAVVEHVLEHGAPVVMSAEGKPLYEISVRKLGESDFER